MYLNSTWEWSWWWEMQDMRSCVFCCVVKQYNTECLHSHTHSKQIFLPESKRKMELMRVGIFYFFYSKLDTRLNLFAECHIRRQCVIWQKMSDGVSVLTNILINHRARTLNSSQFLHFLYKLDTPSSSCKLGSWVEWHTRTQPKRVIQQWVCDGASVLIRQIKVPLFCHQSPYMANLHFIQIDLPLSDGWWTVIYTNVVYLDFTWIHWEAIAVSYLTDL
jgi:hypothetical protein